MLKCNCGSHVSRLTNRMPKCADSEREVNNTNLADVTEKCSFNLANQRMSVPESLIYKVDDTFAKPGKLFYVRVVARAVPVVIFLFPVIALGILLQFAKVAFSDTLAIAAVAIAIGSLSFQYIDDFDDVEAKIREGHVFFKLKKETDDPLILRALIRLRMTA